MFFDILVRNAFASRKRLCRSVDIFKFDRRPEAPNRAGKLMEHQRNAVVARLPKELHLYERTITKPLSLYWQFPRLPD